MRTPLPAGYLEQCKRTGHKPITAEYAVWLVTVKGLRPAVVPGTFTEGHLDRLPPDERKRWLRVARRRYLARRRTKGQKVPDAMTNTEAHVPLYFEYVVPRKRKKARGAGKSK